MPGPNQSVRCKVAFACFCAHYLYEKEKYPRPGMIEKKLAKDDIVYALEKFTNMEGTYIRVEKDGLTYDVEPAYLNTDIPSNQVSKLSDKYQKIVYAIWDTKRWERLAAYTKSLSLEKKQ